MPAEQGRPSANGADPRADLSAKTGRFAGMFEIPYAPLRPARHPWLGEIPAPSSRSICAALHYDASIRVTRIVPLALSLAVVLASAVGASAEAFDRFEHAGITFTYPSGWRVTTKPLSNGLEPVYRFALSSFPVHRTAHDIGPCLAGIAAQRRPDGVLAFVREARGADRRRGRFPRRPRVFPLPTQRDNAGCLGEGSLSLSFRESGRAFLLWIAVGPDASSATRRLLRRTLDHMSIRAI